jgi:hypothetical protein
VGLGSGFRVVVLADRFGELSQERASTACCPCCSGHRPCIHPQGDIDVPRRWSWHSWRSDRHDLGANTGRTRSGDGVPCVDIVTRRLGSGSSLLHKLFAASVVYVVVSMGAVGSAEGDALGTRSGTQCRDGWVSRSSGPGTCSHHDGVSGPTYLGGHPPNIPWWASPSSGIVVGCAAWLLGRGRKTHRLSNV